MEKLTNSGKPHVCRTFQPYFDSKDGVTLCGKCDMPVDSNPMPIEKLKEEFAKENLDYFQDQQLEDPRIKYGECDTGISALVVNDGIQKRAMSKADKVADWWINKILEREKELYAKMESLKTIHYGEDNGFIDMCQSLLDIDEK